MTISKGLTTVILTALGFGVSGAGIGYGIGRVAPQYYRLVFGWPDDRPLDSELIGLAAGLTQGVMTGVVVGLGVVLIVTWYEIRKLNKPVE